MAKISISARTVVTKDDILSGKQTKGRHGLDMYTVISIWKSGANWQSIDCTIGTSSDRYARTMQDYPAGMDDALDGERGAGQCEGVILSNISDTDK